MKGTIVSEKETAASKGKPKKTRAASAKAKKPVRRRKWSKMPKEDIEELFARFSKQRPNPRGELDYSSAYTLLVAVVLSAQATDVGVNKATGPLFAVADTPEKMVALGQEAVESYIKTIGLYRNKAKNVILLSQKLIDEFGGEVPADRDALVSLPGVGRKTANVVLNIFFGQPTIAVDTHIFRLSNRLELAPGKTVEEVEMALEHVIPEPYVRHSITGSSYTDVMSARRASPIARNALLPISAATRKRPIQCPRPLWNWIPTKISKAHPTKPENSAHRACISAYKSSLLTKGGFLFSPTLFQFRLFQTVGLSMREGFEPETHLWTCTMKAVANRGVRRLRKGTTTNSEISRPDKKIFAP